MALLTAEDVLNKAFSKTKYREGFDQDEVDDFLDEVAHTVQSLTAERDDLAKRLAQAQAGASSAHDTSTDAESAPSTEGGLLAAATDPTPPSATGMLAMAQKLHDEYVQAGESERDRLIDDAKNKAESIVEQAETDARSRMEQLTSERSELERKIDDLRRFERDYRGRLKSYLENLLGDLDHGGGSSSSGGSAPSAPSSSQQDQQDEQSSTPAFGQFKAAERSSTPAEQGSAPSAPSSPWAQARRHDDRPSQSEGGDQSSDASQADDSSQGGDEAPAPWGASAYRPVSSQSHSDVASTFGGGAAQQDEDKNP